MHPTPPTQPSTLVHPHNSLPTQTSPTSLLPNCRAGSVLELELGQSRGAAVISTLKCVRSEGERNPHLPRLRPSSYAFYPAPAALSWMLHPACFAVIAPNASELHFVPSIPAPYPPCPTHPLSATQGPPPRPRRRDCHRRLRLQRGGGQRRRVDAEGRPAGDPGSVGVAERHLPDEISHERR